MRPLTLGTAGHIDHGKTALVRALTGTDTDRLPEEKERGISIALGYAALDLPSGRRLSVVDVPGHERFVRTMVAGATGIDLFLMVIAADDGVMPQTREHAAVLEALAVRTGVVAVTKADLADPGDAVAAARELLPGAAVVPVASPSGAGLPELRAALDRAASALASRADAGGPLRLHVDRVFTVRGAGTVVTGTLWGGTLVPGTQVLLYPGARHARVRSVQVHDAPVEIAQAGQRVALNLVGRVEPQRGDVVTDGELEVAYRVVARLRLREPAREVTVHHGTRESRARLHRLDGELWQLRLRTPIVAVPGDRLVVRSIAPPDTLGGGVVVEIPRRVPEPTTAPAPAVRAVPAPAPLDEAARAVEARLRDAWFAPPLDAELDPGALAALRAHGRAVRVGPSMHFHAEALEDARQRLVTILEAEGTITLARLRDELGFSRKYAQALLEHFDSERVTLRRGDTRVLRRSHTHGR